MDVWVPFASSFGHGVGYIVPTSYVLTMIKTFFRSIAHVCVDTLLRGPFGLIVKASR